MAQTSSLSCRACRNRCQTPHSLNVSALFFENSFSLNSALSHHLPKKSVPKYSGGNVSFSSISISTVGGNGARVSLSRFSLLAFWVVVVVDIFQLPEKIGHFLRGGP